MNNFLGVVFIVGGVIASTNNLLHTATLFVVLACYYFLREDLARIERKIK